MALTATTGYNLSTVLADSRYGTTLTFSPQRIHQFSGNKNQIDLNVGFRNCVLFYFLEFHYLEYTGKLMRKEVNFKITP